jgi:hypothetical protein
MKNIIKALKKTLVNKRIIILVLVIMAYIASKNEVGFARIILGFIAIPITIFALGLLWRPKINFYIVITTIFCLFLLFILYILTNLMKNNFLNNMLPSSLVLITITLILQYVKKIYSGEPIADDIGNLQEIFIFIIIAFLPSIFSLDWFFNLVFSLTPVLWFFFKKNLKDIQK